MPQKLNDDTTDFIEESGLNVTDGVKNLFLCFLQEFFAQQKEYTWKQDEDETDIIIADKMPNDLSVLDKQPLIILHRGSIRPMNTSIDKVKSRNIQDGSVEYTDLFTGNIRFDCINRLGLEAERLGTRVALALITFEPILRHRGIHEYKNVTIGEEAAVQADSDIVATNCPVNLRFTAQYTWRLTQEAPDVEGATVTLCIDDDKLVQQFENKTEV